MSVQFNRRCSIGIESPNTQKTNIPLNAFLIYHNHDNQILQYHYPPGKKDTYQVHSPTMGEIPKHVLHNRRVSICDLNNFDDDSSLSQDNNNVNRMIHEVSSEFKKHRRRPSTALRFHEPWVLSCNDGKYIIL